MNDSVEHFYRTAFPQGTISGTKLVAPCPFCATLKDEGNEGNEGVGKITVSLNRKSFFYGYFCCNHCLEHGFADWFSQLSATGDSGGLHTADDLLLFLQQALPSRNINDDVENSLLKLQGEELPIFRDAAVAPAVLRDLRVGFNGRYIVYPYEQWDTNVYSARCVHPDNSDDFFWYGDSDFAGGETGLFNLNEIKRCSGGALFLCEGEENLPVLRQLGYPGIAYWDCSVLNTIDVRLFSSLSTIFLVPLNKEDSLLAARHFAVRVGHKVRILSWQNRVSVGASLLHAATAARKEGRNVAPLLGDMVASSRPFSPFPDPAREYTSFLSVLKAQREEEKLLKSGFPLLDERLGGVQGINILGGGPKVGKSCFTMQIATSMALAGTPVLYYDFENGRQRIYQRTLIRLSGVSADELIHATELKDDRRQRLQHGQKQFQQMLQSFRVINDRKITPEIMRRHIDFMRHEMRRDSCVVVIDSLHKLPFKDLAEMRTGIDSWLRELEAIRDSLHVSFLVISELQRGVGGTYDDAPHMGIFKGSGDIEYSADNAMVLLPSWNHMQEMDARRNALWVVGSREHSPGLVAEYALEYPYWGFSEHPPVGGDNQDG